MLAMGMILCKVWFGQKIGRGGWRLRSNISYV